MALILLNPDGTYASRCALCAQPLSTPMFSTTHFIGEESDEFWPYSDTSMHWHCYAAWPKQPRFAARWFDALSAATTTPTAPFWPVLLQTEFMLVRYGVAVDEVSISLRNRHRPPRAAKRLALLARRPLDRMGPSHPRTRGDERSPRFLEDHRATPNRLASRRFTSALLRASEIRKPATSHQTAVDSRASRTPWQPDGLWTDEHSPRFASPRSIVRSRSPLLLLRPHDRHEG